MVFETTAVPEISFIVPVYNAEKYLQECLDSIVCQLKGNELILIDDGSSDSSGNICDEYAAIYSEITVLHTENKGASSARNLGVSTAQGRFIVFVDSDDFISKDFSAEFRKKNITADVIFFPIRKLLKNGETVMMNDGVSPDILMKGTAEEVLIHISNCSKFPASPCGKLVLRKFLIENQISFEFNRISEDYDWTYQLLQYARCFDYFERGMYTYRQLPQSRSSMGSSRSVEDQLVILMSWEGRGVPDAFRKTLNSFLAYEYAMILPFYGALTKEEREKYRSRLHRCAYLLKYGKSRKLKLIQTVSKLIGIELTSKILYQYISWRNKRYGK